MRIARILWRVSLLLFNPNKIPDDLMGIMGTGNLDVVARDQEVDITTQLNLGVRMLQAQSHMCVSFSEE